MSDSTAKREVGTPQVKRGMAQMLKGGVIMDVVTPEQAKIAEDAGAVAVMALERVPADNIDRAVKRGSGAEAGGANYETIMYEGYGPNGVAFLVECLTDNRNRAASDVRLGFTRHGGSLADPGSVSYLFSRRGIVEVPAADGVDEESIMMAVLDAGAEEVEDAGELFVIESDPKDVVAVRTALQEAGIDYDSAEVQFVASTEVELDLEGALKVNKLIDALEDSDDVQNIYTNMSLSDEVRAQLEEQE